MTSATLTAICADGSTDTLLVDPAGTTVPLDSAQQRWEGEGGRLATTQRHATAARRHEETMRTGTEASTERTRSG